VIDDYIFTMNLTDRLYNLCFFCCDFEYMDTITYKDKNGIEKCIKSSDSNKIYFSLNFSAFESVTWYINGDSVQYGMDKDANGYFFPLYLYDSLWTNNYNK